MEQRLKLQCEVEQRKVELNSMNVTIQRMKTVLSVYEGLLKTGHIEVSSSTF